MNNEQDTAKKKKPLAVGFSDFKEVRENNCYYIDKSMFVKEITEAFDQNKQDKGIFNDCPACGYGK